MTAAAAPAPAWSYDALRREGLSLIPAYAPEWTDHNPTDPGIALVELLAYLADILVYRAGRVTPDARLNLLALLGGGDAAGGLVGGPAAAVDAAIAARIAGLARPECLVTARDFEQRAVALAREIAEGDPDLRARCLPADALGGAGASPADLVVVLAAADPPLRERLGALSRRVAAALAPDCPLATHVAVVPATTLEIGLAARIAPRPGTSLATAAPEASAAVARLAAGWFAGDPFGCTLQLAMVAAAIDAAEAVEFVESVRVESLAVVRAGRRTASAVGVRVGEHARPGDDAYLGGSAADVRRRFDTDVDGEIEAIAAAPWEVLDVRLSPDAVERAAGDG